MPITVRLQGASKDGSSPQLSGGQNSAGCSVNVQLKKDANAHIDTATNGLLKNIWHFPGTACNMC